MYTKEVTKRLDIFDRIIKNTELALLDLLELQETDSNFLNHRLVEPEFENVHTSAIVSNYYDAYKWLDREIAARIDEMVNEEIDKVGIRVKYIGPQSNLEINNDLEYQRLWDEISELNNTLQQELNDALPLKIQDCLPSVRFDHLFTMYSIMDETESKWNELYIEFEERLKNKK